MGQFHAPDDYRAPRERRLLRIVGVRAGHRRGGSGRRRWGVPPRMGLARLGPQPQQAVTAGPWCCTAPAARPATTGAGFGEGNGPIYSRYARLTDDGMDENHFPILWRSRRLPDPRDLDVRPATAARLA